MRILIKSKIYCSLIVLLCLSSIVYSQNRKLTVEQNFDFIWNAQAVSSANIDSILQNLSDSAALEFTGIYSTTKTIPLKDGSILAKKLMQLKFSLITSGRGNWMKGPRMINYFLESDRLICRVDKLYYSDKENPKQYIVTERIACLVKR